MKKNLNKILLEAIHRGINLALDDFDDEELVGQQTLTIKDKNITKEYFELLDYVVDLELPSKTLWCKYNLGVNLNLLSNAKKWYGDYYAWGETIPNKSNGYNYETYQFKKNLFKYNKEDHLTELQFIDDAAYLNTHLYNFKFKMPTKKLFEELIEETNNEWVENFNNSGVNGYKFTSKLDPSKYIFLPATGFCGRSGLNGVGAEGNYWSSSLETDVPSGAWNLYFDDGEFSIDTSDRCYGFSVRPVINL